MSDVAAPADVLLTLICLAGPEGASTSALKSGCLMVRNQEPLLDQLERDGLLASVPAPFKFSGRIWRSVNAA
jgi:hypothetical protein